MKYYWENRRTPRVSLSPFLRFTISTQKIFLKSVITFTAAFLFTVFSCSADPPVAEKSNPEEQILASVGDEVITVEEFRKSYETGFAHVKTGEDRKRTYLEYMIREKLLSLEGFRLGLDKSGRVQEELRRLQNELLIEALIETEVKSKIEVSQEEIREAINKSKVSFKFRFWTEPSRDKAGAIAQAMRERGYAEVVEELANRNPERKLQAGQLESDYLTYLEIPPELLAAIKDLPIGDISDPVELHGRFYIFQVLDVRRQGVTESEYHSRASTFRKIVFYEKLDEALVSYIASVMEPKEVVVKRESFALLEKALPEWEKMNREQRPRFLSAVEEASEGGSSLLALRSHLDEPFLTYRSGSLSTREFLEYFDPSKIASDEKSTADFRTRLHAAVKQSIRDYFLIREASARNLQEHPLVHRQLSLWRENWVYQETRSHLAQEAESSGRKSEDYFSERIESLKARYPVEIYQAVLDTVRVIDFQKSRWATLQIFKSGSNRPAYPTVDPRWGREDSKSGRQ